MPPSYGPNEGAYLYVYGTLMALGESGKEIVFTASEEGGPYWPGIIFEADNPETTVSSQLEYVRIEKARSWENPYFASVKVDKKLISIKNSIIENFQIGETWAANTGLVLKNSYSAVDKVTFLNYKNPDHLNYSSDSATAIRIEGGAPIIKNSKFQGNWIGIILQTTEACLSNPNFEISKNDFQQNQVPIFLINYGMPCFSQNQATTSGIDNYGNELNGILVGDVIFSKDTLWSVDLPYIVRGVTIQNSTATIAAGTKIKFRYSPGIGETGYLRVENSGRLICQGEPDNYILFTSARQNPQPGNWQSIWFKYPSSGILRYVEIEYGGWNFPEKGVLKIDSGAEVVQENVVIDSTKNILP
jgi:hypothetical protein